MSRIELHCPSCGYDVPMTLLPPPKMFECPECQEVIPRDKLTRLKVLHRHIAGAVPPLFQIGQVGSFSDLAATGTAVSPMLVDLKNGEMFVAIIGTIGGSQVPDSVQLGTDDLTLITEVLNEPLISVRYFIGTSANQSPKALTIVSNSVSNPSEIVCIMLRITGQAVSPIDKSSTSVEVGTSVNWTSGNTAVQTAFNDLAIGAYVGEGGTGEDSSIAPFFVNPAGTFQQGQRKQGQNVTVMQASRQLSSKAATAFTGTKVIDASAAVSVFTIKPK